MTNRLRVLRSEFRISQADLAARLGVARQTIHSIENDKFAPSLTLAFRIATLLGREITDVFQPGPAETMHALRAGGSPVVQRRAV
jgi:putative transcriptional regulator